jgi:ABC-type multidrug transport system fused ATPase/permease subunit
LAIAIGSLGKLGKLYEKFYGMMASLDKIGHVLDLPLESEQGHPFPRKVEPASFYLQEISYAYGGHTALNDLTLSIPAGESLALLGPPASGKSTLLDLLYGIRPPKSGQLLFDGVEMRGIQPADLRRDIALIRQVEIIHKNIFDNIAAGRKEIGRVEVRQALEDVGLGEIVFALPDGLNTLLHPNGAPFSHQQAIQLTFARIFAAKPRIILIDGLLDQLDPHALTPLLQKLFAPDAPWTLILVTHRHDLVRLCRLHYHLDQKTLFKHDTSSV